MSMYFDYGGLDEVTIAEGLGLTIQNSGSIILSTKNNNSLKLHVVLHVPRINRNLISVSKLCQSNQVYVEFFSRLFSCEGPDDRSNASERTKHK